MILSIPAVVTALATNWSIKIIIIRESSTAIRAVAIMSATTSSGTVIVSNTQVTPVTGLTLSNPSILKITGQAGGTGAATNDIVAQLGTVLFQPGA